MKGSIPLIDLMGALTIILIIYSVFGNYSLGYKGLIEESLRKEEIRRLFYEELFSGRLSSSDFSDHLVLPNGIIINDGPPREGVYLTFFLSVEGGMRVFFVCKKG